MRMTEYVSNSKIFYKKSVIFSIKNNFEMIVQKRFLIFEGIFERETKVEEEGSSPIQSLQNIDRNKNLKGLVKLAFFGG